MAEILYDATVVFCDGFICKYTRKHYQVKAEAVRTPIRDFSHYEVIVPQQSDMPHGVTLEVKI